MPTDETLDARIQISGTPESDLESIAESFRDVAKSALNAAEGAYLAADAFDEAKDEGNSLSGALDRIASSSSEAGTSLQGVFGAGETAAEGLDEAEDESSSLNRELLQTTRRATSASTALAGLGAVSTVQGGPYFPGEIDTDQIGDDVLPEFVGEEEFDARHVVDQDIEFEKDRLTREDILPEILGREEFEARDAVVEKDIEVDRDRVLEEDVIPQILREDEFEKREQVHNIRANLTGEKEAQRGMMSTLRQAEVLDGKEINLKTDLDRDRFASPTAGIAASRFPSLSNIGGDDFSFRRIESMLTGGLTGDVDDTEVSKTATKVRSLGDDIAELPNIDMDVADESDLDAFSGNLHTAGTESRRLSNNLADLGDEGDAFIEQSDTTRELRRNLRRTSLSTENLEHSLDELSDSNKRVVDDMLASAESVDEFQDQTAELGRQAQITASSIQSMSGPTKSYILDAAIAAERTDEWGDELRQTGNEAIKTQMKIAATNSAAGTLQETIGDTTTSLGPFTTQLSTVIQLLPSLASGLASVAGLLTAGLAGGAGIAGIFAGGLIEQGDQLVDQMEATGEATEEMEEAEGLERTMLGLQELMSRVGEAAMEAFAPLREPRFADFAMRGIEEVLKLLGEFAKVVSWGADELMNALEVIGAAWWDTYPEFIGELVYLMEQLGPLLTQIAVGAIEFLPEIFRMMTAEGQSVVPMLMEFVSALMDVMPALLALGTMMLHGVLPNLIGMLEGFAALSPAIIFFARVVSDVLQVLDPVIQALFAIGSAALVLNSVIPFLTMSVSLLSTMFSVLVASPILTLFWSLVSVGMRLYPILVALSKITLAGAFHAAAGAAYTLYGILLKLVTVSIVGWAKAAAGALMTLYGAIMSVVGGMTLLGLVITGGIIIAAIAALVYGVLSYFDLWEEAIWGIMKAWNALVRFLAAAQGIVGGAVEKLVNGAVKALNWFIKKINEVAGTDFGTIDYEYEAAGPEEAEDEMLDPSKADEYAQQVPGAGGGGFGNPLTDYFSRQSDDYRGPDRVASGDSYEENNYHIEGVTGTGDASDERRIQSAVERGVKRANRKERLKNSDMN